MSAERIAELKAWLEECARNCYGLKSAPLTSQYIAELEQRLLEADTAIAQARLEMYWLGQQREFHKGGSCDRALMALTVYAINWLGLASKKGADE